MGRSRGERRRGEAEQGRSRGGGAEQGRRGGGIGSGDGETAAATATAATVADAATVVGLATVVGGVGGSGVGRLRPPQHVSVAICTWIARVASLVSCN